MRLRSTAALLLFALLLALVGGPHPCRAEAPKPSKPHCSAMAGMADMANPGGEAGTTFRAPSLGRGCCGLPGSPSGESAQCERACGLVAVLFGAPTLLPSGLRQALPAPERELRLSLFASSIDHIPL